MDYAASLIPNYEKTIAFSLFGQSPPDTELIQEQQVGRLCGSRS